MAKTKVGINGFGRIGRLVARSILKRYRDEIEIVGINDLTNASTLAHLFKYDSVQGNYQGDVEVSGDTITIDGMEIQVSSEKDPTKLNWDELGAEIVVESTGLFRTRDDAEKHLQAGADKVIISAPAKGNKPVKTIVLGVNDDEIEDDADIYSNASCTTNCLAPMVKVIDDAFGIKHGFMTTVHAYTGGQNIVDGPHKDLRRGRAAAHNIVPTTTGAAKAVGLVLPHLDGKLDGKAVRVPVPAGSLTDLTVVVDQDTSEEEVTDAFKKAATGGALQPYLEFSEEELVSNDILGNDHSCIFDSKLTHVDGNLIKVIGWYDNESGYSARTADLISKLAK